MELATKEIGNIEGSTTKMNDEKVHQLLVKSKSLNTIGDGGSHGFIHNLKNVKLCEFSCILDRLSLTIVKIRRYCDDARSGILA